MKRPNLPRALAALSLLALPLGAEAQQADPPPPRQASVLAEVSGWRIEAYAVDGQFMACGAVAPGPARTSFEKSSEGWTIVVATAGVGDELKGAVDIDGTSSGATFYRGDDGRVITFLKEAQIRRIRAGRQVTVSIGTERTALPLAGIAPVLARLQACTDKGGK